MLTIDNLSYKIGGRTIIEDGNLAITDGWKVGIIGVNGAGKSTLFKLISGDLHADGGTISLSQRQRMGVVRQDVPETDAPLIDLVLAAHGEMAQLWRDSETEQDPDKVSEIYQRLADLDAYAAPAKAATLLMGLGFKEHQLQEPFSSFSGGWQMRVMLAAALFVEPDILLLDEPTNHLDLEAIMWLESYLVAYPHTLLVISHDRQLLNKCVDHIVHVDKQKLTLYSGDYDTFERERAMRLGLQQKMHEKQQAERAHIQQFVDRFKAKASKARQAQSRVKALERMDIVDAVIADRAVKFTFPDPDKIASPMITLHHADVGYTAGVPILKRVNDNIDNDDRIALLGANGNGKSTLMKLIAGKLGIMGGNMFRSGKLRIGYFSQHQTEELDVTSTPYLEMQKLMLKKFPEITEPKIRAKLGQFGFSRELSNNLIGSLSGGEKARLLFAFMSFDAPHLLLLDEPTNHLDIEAREALVQALNNYQGAIIIVSHDPNMVERVADRLWLIKDGAVQDFDGNLEDYRKFTIQSGRDARKAEKSQKKTTIPPDKLSAKKIDLRDVETAMEALTADKVRLETAMAHPDFYKDSTQAAQTQTLYARVCQDLEAKEESWLIQQSA
ncbi:MAG: ABC-F family ATP-binding cassette domain-containing protein [Pseudomonadota bacterium]